VMGVAFSTRELLVDVIGSIYDYNEAADSNVWPQVNSEGFLVDAQRAPSLQRRPFDCPIREATGVC
jgi:hypothetical protein